MTHSRTVPVVGIPDATATETAVTVPFQLQLSAAAKRVVLRDEADEVLWESSAAVDGMVEATWPRLPRNIQLQVDWVTPGAPRYFAKLRLDPPGSETLMHVFDASSDLDDLWELP